MKNRLIAALSVFALMSAQAVAASADWDNGYTDYGYNDYGYTDYGYNDYNNYGTDDQTTSSAADDDDTGYYTGSEADSSSQSDDIPLTDPFKDAPVTVKLQPTKIVDKKFTAELFIDSNTDITAADLTITYDSKVLKLNKTTINKKIKGTLAAAETAPGTVQLQYTNEGGSQSYDESSETDSSDSAAEETKPGYITLDFEITDVTERSTVLYITVNSLRDLSSTEVTYRADGTIIQIEGAVPVDASADESMYTELRVARSDSLVLFESIGLANVKQATLSNPNVATAEEKGIKTLENGLTNMTVEFADGTIKYYRLVVSESAPVITTTQAAESVADPAVVTDPNGQTVQPAADDVQPGEIVKTQTNSQKKVKYLLIYIVVIVAVIAIFAEFFFFFGNPYKRTFAILNQRKSEKQLMQEALYGEENEFPDEQGDSQETEEEYTEEPTEEEYTEEDYSEESEETQEEYTDEEPSAEYSDEEQAAEEDLTKEDTTEE